MEKIPFDIKFRPDIEAGKYLVVTRDNNPVRIVCWDKKGSYPILGLIKTGMVEKAETFLISGSCISDEGEYDSDLFLVYNIDYKGSAIKSTVSAKSSMDWDDFRRDAAKDFASAMLSNSELVYENSCSYRLDVNKLAVIYADELIKRLKEEKE